jgi:hypothetical protein
MPQEIALIFNLKYPYMRLNTLQIKWCLKYLDSKENKSHVNISISLENNEHCYSNVIENISIKNYNNIPKNILSSNIIHQNFDVHLFIYF